MVAVQAEWNEMIKIKQNKIPKNTEGISLDKEWDNLLSRLNYLGVSEEAL